MDNTAIKFIKKGEGLIPATERDFSLFNLYNTQLSEGSIVNAYFDKIDSEKSLGQLAKVHKLIRILSTDTGYTFDEMKNLVKFRAGLYVKINGDINYKSFSACSKDELGLAIQSCIDIGINTGSVLY